VAESETFRPHCAFENVALVDHDRGQEANGEATDAAVEQPEFQAGRDNVKSSTSVGTPHRETLAAALLVIGLIMVIVSFSWIDSPGLASSPDAGNAQPTGASLPAPDVPGAKLESDTSAGQPDSEPTSQSAAVTPQVTQADEVDVVVAKPPKTVKSTKSESAITAETWFVLDTESGDELAGEGVDDEVAIASTVKIVTALVTLLHVDLADEVTIEESDLVDPMVHSNMMLMVGDTLTVEQLLQGLLIPSGSDAANALARYVGTQIGDDPDPDTAIALFVDTMNAYVEELGLEHTRFANPTGDDDADSYSSAHDIAILGAELMANPALAEIAGMSDYSFTSLDQGNTYTGVTTNQLLDQNGIIGIKTGSTGEAGGCVILARETTDGGTQIIAILGADIEYTENIITLDTRWDDARAIIALVGNQ